MDDDASARWAPSEASAARVQMFLPRPYTTEKLLKALAQLLRGAKELKGSVE